MRTIAGVMSKSSIFVGRVFTGFLAALALSAAIDATQDETVALRERLKQERQLGTAEIDQVLERVRIALADRPFRISMGYGRGPEVVTNVDGHIRLLRTSDNNGLTIGVFTGRPARFCDGRPLSGELVIEYRQAGAGWTIRTRVATSHEVGAAAVAVLSQTASIHDAGLLANGHGRALTAPWSVQENNIEEEFAGGRHIRRETTSPAIQGTQTLWIDGTTFWPLRWELRVPPGTPHPITYFFEYVDVPPLVPPTTGIAPPDCVDPQRR